MAHRKPLGTTFTSTLDWPRGHERPGLGDYLVSQAGTWYRVVGVIEVANPDKIRLMEKRIAGPDGPGRVFEFEWYPRERRRTLALH